MDTNAPVGGAEAIVSVPVVTPADSDSISASEAARQLSSFRWKRDNPDAVEQQPAAPEQAAAADDLAETPDSDPQEEVPAEQTPEAEPAEKPPIDPPRSWTKEAKERWSALPPETQEYLAQREQERDREVRRSQNEAAENRKAIEAERQQAEQVRKQYEAQLPALMQALQEAQAGTFSDIKTMDDVTRLAAEDPFRYLQWQAHQTKLQAVNYEAEQAKSRQANEHKSAWATHVQTENAKAAEHHPELADPAKAKSLQSAAIDLLSEKGFTQDELTKLGNGDEKLSIFDHRVQSLLIDGVKYQQAQKAPPKAIPKPVPAVQKPGVAAPRISAASAEIQALEKTLKRTGRWQDAAALRAAQTRARA
jgi:hypothetical protein